MKRNILYIFMILLIITGCQIKNSKMKSDHLKDQRYSMSMASKLLVKHVWRNSNEKKILWARQAFYNMNRNEILNTIQIVDSTDIADIGVTYVRFSIGSNMYRDVVWMRKVNNSWYPTSSQYFSEYSDAYENLNKKQQVQADSVLKKIKKWEKANPKNTWWLW